MAKAAISRFPENASVRLVSPEPLPHVQRRPVVDIDGLAARAANEIVEILADWRRKQAKADRSFLKRRQPKPSIDLFVVTKNLRQAVETAYRGSAARCEPPLLDMDENHLAEITALQEQAIELFCRDILRAVRGDADLEGQVYELCPALKPPPEPDGKVLSGLQKRMDKAIASCMAAHENLILTLMEMDNLVREEAQALAGTSAVGNGRIQRQAEHVRHELVRLLERGEVCRQIKIPAARW